MIYTKARSQGASYSVAPFQIIFPPQNGAVRNVILEFIFETQINSLDSELKRARYIADQKTKGFTRLEDKLLQKI